MAGRGRSGDWTAAMLVHPDNADTATAYALACQGIDVEFIGKPATQRRDPMQVSTH